DVGLDCEWQVIYGREEFFNATKLMHNALQGAPEDLSEEQWETWERYNEMNSRELTPGWDVAIVHDPQPAALYSLVPEKARAWVWRCHIDAYRIVKERVPSVQLALVGSMASDDPEGWDYFNATVAHAGGDPDIHILNNFNNVGSIEVNAFQSHADVVIQKSTREGFGLTVTEALWKGRPFIGGNVGGIPLQVENGISGYLVSDVETCAARSLDILM